MSLISQHGLSQQLEGDGSSPRARTIPVTEEVQREMRTARLRLGPLRLFPTASLSDTGYTNNVLDSSNPTERQDDFTATAAAGSRFLLPIGTKSFLRGSVVPTYTWYAHQAERRSLGGRYQAALLGLFNRLSFEAGGSLSKVSRFLSSETEQPIVDRSTEGRVSLEVDILRRLSVFAGAHVSRVRLSGTQGLSGLAVRASSLDNDGAGGRGGLRYRFRDDFNVAVLYERSRSEFVTEGEFRDYEARGGSVSVRHDRRRFYLSLRGGYRESRPLNGSRAPSYTDAVGSAFASYFVTPAVELQLFAGRAPVNSLIVETPYFIESRYGGGLNVAFGRRLILRTSAEAGQNRYIASTGGSSGRRDRVTTIGGGLSILLFRATVVNAMASYTRYTSNAAGFDRSTFRLSTGLTFEGFPSRETP